MIIDTHTHILDKRLDCCRETILNELSCWGISKIIEVGFDMPSSVAAAQLAKKNNNVYCAVGVHPHDAKLGVDKAVLTSLAQDSKCVAIGEIGLDYYYDLSDREVQKSVFTQQIKLAYQLKKPMILHVRDAYADTMQILSENKQLLCYGINLHCYSGSAEMIKEFSKFDAYFAFGGAITFKNAKKDAVLKAVPLNRILLETDCPYMTPEPHRGKPNMPQYTRFVLEKAAQILQISEEKLAQITTENAYRLFGF